MSLPPKLAIAALFESVIRAGERSREVLGAFGYDRAPARSNGESRSRGVGATDERKLRAAGQALHADLRTENVPGPRVPVLALVVNKQPPRLPNPVIVPWPEKRSTSTSNLWVAARLTLLAEGFIGFWPTAQNSRGHL